MRVYSNCLFVCLFVFSDKQNGSTVEIRNDLWSVERSMEIFVQGEFIPTTNRSRTRTGTISIVVDQLVNSIEREEKQIFELFFKEL